MKPLILLLALCASTLCTADDDHAWRERDYQLSGAPQPESDRKPLYRIKLRGAKQLRLHFEQVRLTRGESLEIYDARLNLIQRVRVSARNFWSRTIVGELAWVRLRHPGDDGEEGEFSIDKVALRKTLPAPAKGSRSPSHYVPALTTVKLFRVYPSGDHDRLAAGSRLRLGRQGQDPDSLDFAVYGYDQKQLLLSQQQFRPAVRYDGSRLKGRLTVVRPGVWRFRAGAFAAEGLTIAIGIPDKPALSTSLKIDILDHQRAHRPLHSIRVWRRRANGRLQPLSSASVLKLAARGEGLDRFDLSIVGLDRKGRMLPPTVLRGLRFDFTPKTAGRIETKLPGEYRLYTGPRGVQAGSLVLRIGAHEDFRLTLQILASATDTIGAATPVRRATDQPFSLLVTSRLAVGEAYRTRKQFELSGDPPALLDRVTLVLADGTRKLIHSGALQFQTAWRWKFSSPASPALVAVEVRWKGKAGATLRLRTRREFR